MIFCQIKKGVVNVAAGLITAFIFFFLYVGSFNTDYLFNTHIHGLAGLKVCSSCWNLACDFNNDLKGGVFVALKQTRGEDNVLFGIKLKQIPMIYLFAACLLVLAGLGKHVKKWLMNFQCYFLVSLPYFVLLSSGVMSAWIYLRFYQRHSRGRGDLADHFSFASFFPRVFRVSKSWLYYLEFANEVHSDVYFLGTHRICVRSSLQHSYQIKSLL